jgi:hypothetical protein
MKKKSDISYIIVNILCLVLLIVNIEFKDYFRHLYVNYHAYLYPLVMTNLAGPLIVCLLVVYRQTHHQKASLSTKIVIDSCSGVVFLAFNFYELRFDLLTKLPPESFILLCLFIIPAIYNIYGKIKNIEHIISPQADL